MTNPPDTPRRDHTQPSRTAKTWAVVGLIDCIIAFIAVSYFKAKYRSAN